MQFSLLYLLALIAIVNCAQFECPQSNDVVFPCECFADGSLLCSDIGRRPRIDESALTKAFKSLGAAHSKYYSVLISETGLTQLNQATFQGVAFNKIKLEQNYNLTLSAIDRRAFIASKSSLIEFATVNVGSESDAWPLDAHAWTVFEAFDGFDKLVQLTIAYHRLPQIPRSILGTENECKKVIALISFLFRSRRAAGAKEAVPQRQWTGADRRLRVLSTSAIDLAQPELQSNSHRVQLYVRIRAAIE